MFFDNAFVLKTEPAGIALATRTGKDIPNEIIPNPDQAELAKLDLFERRYGKSWEKRKPHIGGYNCAGHVWASRRTSILDENAIRLILKEDGYRVFRDYKTAMVGDLVLYWEHRIDGVISWLHIGVICEWRRTLTIGAKHPWVLSKFGSGTGEWLHRYDDVPYNKPGWEANLIIEFCSDRP